MHKIAWLFNRQRCHCIPWHSPTGARHTKDDHNYDCIPTPPCGGCARCIAIQYRYYYQR